MLRITEQEVRIVTLNDLREGDCFRYSDSLYQKVSMRHWQRLRERSVEDVNAYCWNFEEYRFITFRLGIEVTPINLILGVDE